MSRSSWKGFFLDPCLSPFKINEKKNYFKVWSRRSTITLHLVNKTLYIYNGKIFEKLLITPDMIGFKFGDFIFTKKRGKFIHLKQVKKKNIKSKKK